VRRCAARRCLGCRSQGGELTGSDEIGGDDFGGSVALSSDGNTVLIGGEEDDRGIGAVWVFTRVGEIWTQQGEKLTGSGESGTGLFGTSVALSSNGNTALIGGWGDNEGVGAAWAFVNPEATAPTVTRRDDGNCGHHSDDAAALVGISAPCQALSVCQISMDDDRHHCGEHQDGGDHLREQ
jgi:hypothetical protein